MNGLITSWIKLGFIETINPQSRSVLASLLAQIGSQRELRPIGEYDMPMYDAALLCAKMDLDKNNDTTTEAKPDGYLPSADVPEDLERPCGWWVPKPCNFSLPKMEPHFSLEPANPEPKWLPESAGQEDDEGILADGEANSRKFNKFGKPKPAAKSESTSRAQKNKGTNKG